MTIEAQIDLHRTAAQAHEAAAAAHRDDAECGYEGHPAQYSWHQTAAARMATLAIDPTGVEAGWEEAVALDLQTTHSSAAESHGHAAKAHWAVAKELRDSEAGRCPGVPCSECPRVECLSHPAHPGIPETGDEEAAAAADAQTLVDRLRDQADACDDPDPSLAALLREAAAWIDERL